MKSRTMLLMLGLGLALPVLASDGEKKKEAGTDKDQKTEKASPIQRLAELRIDEYVVPARMINLPLPGKTKTVQDILDRLEEWSGDEKIGAILLDVGFFGLSMPDIEELRAGIARVKKNGKKVMAYLHGFSPNGYLLASAADEIAMAPSASLIIPGIGRVFPFLKGHYQMRGIEYDVITAGKYKYPGFLNEREPNKYFQEEIDAVFDGWIGDYKNMIAEGRGMTPEAVTEAIDFALFSGTQARDRGLVDSLAYYEDYRDRILQRDKLKKLRDKDRGLAGVNSIQDIFELINEELRRDAEARKAVGPKIAVLHARGVIIDLNLGPAFASQLICRDDFSKVVDELRKNKSIKAVVLHIDSPGGSGYASDVIWKHLRRLDDAKPLVVAMGTVAGSGGYYIACPARRIFAHPTTITGSIGVLGIIPSARSLYNRIDYELVEMKRGDRATLGSPHRELSKKDRAFLQDYMDDFYDIFIDRVAQTRRMPDEEVRKIAEGRIWTGRDAVEIGLVDELGGIAEAIEAARSLAGIPPSADLKIVHYPRPSSLGELLESVSSVSVIQMVEAFSQGITAAPTITFDQQLGILSARLQPLCWMAVPDFYRPQVPSELDLFSRATGLGPRQLPGRLIAP